MYEYFYSYFNKRFAENIFNRETEDGTPSPPISQFLLDNDLQTLLDNDGTPLID